MIGQMNQRVIFAAQNKKDNGRGGSVIDKDNPIFIAEVWAAVKVISRQEVFKYQGVKLSANVEVTIRDNPFVDSKQTLIWDGDTYEIEEITPHKKHRGYSVVSCKELN